MRVMTRAHVGKPTVRVPTPDAERRATEVNRDMRWRDRASDRVISGDANKRIVCSLTIRKVFVLTLSFQAKVFLLLKLENVAFAM